MALEAEGAHVGKVALAAAFYDGKDVIGIPQIATAAPIFFELLAGFVVELALVFAQGFGIDAAAGADAAIAGEDLCAQVPRIRTQFPLMDALRAAESKAALGYGRSAPAADAAFAPGDPATGLCAAGTHTRSS